MRAPFQRKPHCLRASHTEGVARLRLATPLALLELATLEKRDVNIGRPAVERANAPVDSVHVESHVDEDIEKPSSL